jgi:uncharacterized membrane protein YdfJ with MMPL/SSD domain
MLSSHRAIWSLGFVVAAGVVCLWAASVATLPALLGLLARRGQAESFRSEATGIGSAAPQRPSSPWRAGEAAYACPSRQSIDRRDPNESRSTQPV